MNETFLDHKYDSLTIEKVLNTIKIIIDNIDLLVELNTFLCRV